MTESIQRKRVLWLSHMLPWPPKGGLMQRSYYLMRELARHHDIQVIALRQKAHQSNEDELQEAIDALSEFAAVVHVSDLPEDTYFGRRAGLALRSLLPGYPYTIRWGRSGAYGEAVRNAVREFRPDLVHIDTISLAQYVPLAGRVPAVLNHHNVESAMLLRRAQTDTNIARKLYFWQEGLRLARYERQLANAFKMHLVCAKLDAERLKDVVGPVNTKEVPNGVDLEYFVPAGPEVEQHAGSMIFVGGLSWYPNASAIRFFLDEVWPLVGDASPNVEFRIVGRNPPPDLVTFADRDPRIQFLGFVDDIRPLVHRSEIYVCPIFDGGGTKLKMIDAMAMGKAIVAHPVACEGLAVTHNKQVVQAATAIEMAQCILELLADPDRRQALAEAARKHVSEHFSFKEIGRDLSQMYSSISGSFSDTTGGNAQGRYGSS